MSSGTSLIDNNLKNEVGSHIKLQPSLSAKDNEAITLFEKGIEKESHGSMSDAVEFYRKAFRINEKVDLLYRTKRVPHNVYKLKQEGGKNIAKRVDEVKVRSIDVDTLLESFVHAEAHAPDPFNPEHQQDEMVTIKFENLDLNEDSIKNIKPISPLMHLPNDIWMHIFEILLMTNPESWFNFSITCKKNAYLGLGSKNIWRKLCYLIYPQQVYYENKSYLESIQTLDMPDDISLPVPYDQLLILPQYQNSWKYMLRNRPFIKFHGCYISVVNYYSEGGKAEFSSSWSNPVKTITYYRYLRFYPDGTCVKVLSTLEPNKVIPNLLKYNAQKSLIPIVADPTAKTVIANTQVPTKESHNIYHGKWTISTTGEIHIEINEGSVPYYIFHYHFQIKSLGGIFKYSKLNWITYYAIRKKMSPNDDREGEKTEFPLKNEKAFKFLKVRSYKVDN
mmetsp:Transcript_9470/g.11454  ORF Transcript_9470/g.11454 Transcript_9470/m.11454 type:complete len:448 (+) Transcript_9470:60-1403(+)